MAPAPRDAVPQGSPSWERGESQPSSQLRPPLPSQLPTLWSCSAPPPDAPPLAHAQAPFIYLHRIYSHNPLGRQGTTGNILRYSCGGLALQTALGWPPRAVPGCRSCPASPLLAQHLRAPSGRGAGGAQEMTGVVSPGALEPDRRSRGGSTRHRSSQCVS